MALSSHLLQGLHERFGFSAFRPGQEAAIEHLVAGRHALVVMPTGAGKFLIYQLAATFLPVPPSRPRPTDPVRTLATALGQRLGVPTGSDWLVKTRAT